MQHSETVCRCIGRCLGLKHKVSLKSGSGLMDERGGGFCFERVVRRLEYLEYDNL